MFFQFMLSVIGSFALNADPAQPIQEVSKQLRAESFQQRAQAQKALSEMASENKDLSTEQILDLYIKTQDPEAKLRIRGILKDSVLKKNLGAGAGFVGIRMGVRQIEGDETGPRFAVFIRNVNKGTPAESAGLQVGDLIIQVDNLVMREISANDVFVDYITSKRPGDQVTFQIRRAGLEVPVKLTLGRFPDALLRQQNAENNRFRRRPPYHDKFDDPESRFFDQWLAEKLKEEVD